MRTLSALLLVAAPGQAAEVDLAGAFRIRPGLVDGQVRPGAVASEAVVETRAILTARVTAGRVAFLGEMRDSRVFGNGPGSMLVAGDVNALEPVQLRLTLDLDGALGEATGLEVTVGRTEMQFGSRRLLGTGDYRNAANFFTGVAARAEGPRGLRVEAFWVLPQNRRPTESPAVGEEVPVMDRERLALQLLGASASGPLGRWGLRAGASAVGIVERDRPGFETRNRRLWTAGPHIVKAPAPGAFDFEVEALIQGGRAATLLDPHGAAVPVRAFLLRAAAGHQWRGPWQPRLALEFDHVSGDRPGGRYQRFDGLFGVRRFEFGPSSIYGVLGRANLTSPGVRFTFAEEGRVDGWIMARGLWAASATDFFSTSGAIDPTGASGRFAGLQVDSRVRVWLVPKRLRADLNATGLARRGVLERAAPGRSTVYAASALEAFF
ncbi:alginate export family protein [Thermaurantiacus sp.]